MAIIEYAYENHDEWLALRAKYLGGSDASSVIGLNPYRSAYELWAEKTGKIPQFEGNLTTKVGSYLEDLVATLFEEETGKKVRRKNRTMVNDLYPFACANIDRSVVGEKAFLEIKTTTSLPIMKKLRSSEEFPEIYYAQVVHYLAVTGLEKAYLAVLINCRELKIYEILRDQDEIEALMAAEREFWTCVETDTPPAVDGTESTSDTIAALYPEADGSTVDLTPFTLELQSYTALSKQIKELKEMQDRSANVIKEYMKGASRGIADGYSVSFSTTERRSFDQKRFVKDHANMDLDDYYTTSTSRMFRVTEKKTKAS